MPDAVETIIL